MIDLFSSDELENCLHAFLCFKGDLYGVHHRPPLVYLLITDRRLYLMNHVHESRLFTLETKIQLSHLRHVTVSSMNWLPNYLASLIILTSTG